MKRIYNNIPLASVLFGVGGKQIIRIVDFTDVLKYNWYGADPDKVPYNEVFCGEWREAPSDVIFRYDLCKMRGIVAEENVLTFYICSEKDKYEG